MSNVFSSTFGGSAVSPTEVAFAAYTFNTSLTLYWPAFSAGNTNVAARFMNLTATANSLNAAMPDATLVSPGYDVIICNKGADTFNLVSFNGVAIVTIATGQTYHVLLTDNTTQDGTWQVTQFGVGTGSAVASQLAGAGLSAIAGLLAVNFNATAVSNSYSITMAERAILQVWTGGSGAITLPMASSVGDGFFFPLANNGSGNATVTASGGDLIDGASTSVFSQTQSGFVISSGAGWYTVGKGLQNTFAVSLLNLNCAGSADITETSAQAENIIQQCTGALTGNINIIVPATVQLYYVFNNTTGSHTLTYKTAAGTGIAVAQGTHSILYCDGTNVVNGYTASVASTVSIAAGSANSPNFNIIGSGSTGIYSPTTNQIAFTAGGFEVMNFISAASSVNYLQVSATASGNAPSISASGSDTNIGILLQPKGTGAVGIPKGVILGGTIDGVIIGGSSAAAITGTTITASSSFVGNLTGNVTGNADTATKLATGRTISITGDLAYTSASFDGSGNVTGTGTLPTVNSNVGSFTNANITVDGKGRITAAATGTTSSGTVTSVTFTGDGTVLSSTPSSAVTASGTLTAALATQTANKILAGPASGSAATPTFRSMVVADLPSPFTNGTISGNTSKFATVSGTLTNTHIAIFDASGNIVDGGAAPVSSQWVLLSTQTASNSPSLDFTSVISSSYDYYFFNIKDIVSASNAVNFLMLMSANNGSTYQSSYNWTMQTLPTLGTSTAYVGSANSSTTAIYIAGTVTSGAANAISGKVELFNPNGTTRPKWVKSEVTHDASAIYDETQGANAINTAVNAVQFKFNSGNITSGIIECWGVKNT